LKKRLKKRARKEEKAFRGWQNGLSQIVSFLSHHPSYLPSPPPRDLQPRLKPSVMPSKLAFFRPSPMLIYQLSLSFATPLKNSHFIQLPLKKLHLPSPKHALTKHLSQMAYQCFFSSFWAGHFLNTSSPCSKPV
jgi:hypothetical protein